MAEYYPLLARAVSAQSNASQETRHGIYERARKALLGQLRAHDPPLPEEDIQREAKALEDAIARVEGELQPTEAAASQASRPSAAPFATPPKAMTLAERARAHRESRASNAVKKSEQPRLQAVSPPVAPPPVATAEIATPVAHAPEPTVIAAPQPVELRAEKGVAPRTFVPVIHTTLPSSNVSEATAPLVFGETKPISFPAEHKTVPPGGMLWKFGRPRSENETVEGGAPADGGDAWSDPVASAHAINGGGETRPEPMRPLAPLAVSKKRGPGLRWAFGALATVVVASVAVLAFMLKDTPQKPPGETPVAAAAPDKVQSKIIDRIGVGPTHMDAAGAAAGSLETQTPTAPGLSPQSSPVSPPSAVATPAKTPTKTPSLAQSVAPPAPAPQQAQVNSLAATAAPAATSQAPLPVAQRAALLVQAPTSTDPQAIATFVGTVVWRLETVARGSGQPPELAVRALVDIPDAHFKASMLLEKNDDASLPASHTMELRFDTDKASALGQVKQIDTPQMRKEDFPAGDSLSGIPTPITGNYFLVGLTKGDPAQSHNIDLMQGAGWFDVPMLLANGKIAKVTFEKGIAGQKALSDALASWGN